MDAGVYSQFTLCCFNLFKSDIDTRSQFEFCWVWLEFSRFSIDFQWMYRYTTIDIHCYLWLQEKMHWKMSLQQAFFFEAITPLKIYNRPEQKQKTKKIKQFKNFPYCFDSSNKAYKHIHKITTVWNKITNH